MDRVPSNSGYMGDLYSPMARRFEKACDFKGGGSVTVVSVVTMPGGDVTHPVPDNTAYITEGQFYLENGQIEPCGSIFELKRHVIGKRTRDDHGAVMNTLIRLYSGARDAAQKEAMAFDLSLFDHRLLKFGQLFEARFMDIAVSMPLEGALDLGWQTMVECFAPEELMMKDELVEKYHPADARARHEAAASSEAA